MLNSLNVRVVHVVNIQNICWKDVYTSSTQWGHWCLGDGRWNTLTKIWFFCQILCELSHLILKNSQVNIILYLRNEKQRLSNLLMFLLYRETRIGTKLLSSTKLLGIEHKTIYNLTQPLFSLNLTFHCFLRCKFCAILSNCFWFFQYCIFNTTVLFHMWFLLPEMPFLVLSTQWIFIHLLRLHTFSEHLCQDLA